MIELVDEKEIRDSVERSLFFSNDFYYLSTTSSAGAVFCSPDIFETSENFSLIVNGECIFPSETSTAKLWGLSVSFSSGLVLSAYFLSDANMSKKNEDLAFSVHLIKKKQMEANDAFRAIVTLLANQRPSFVTCRTKGSFSSILVESFLPFLGQCPVFFLYNPSLGASSSFSVPSKNSDKSIRVVFDRAFLYLLRTVCVFLLLSLAANYLYQSQFLLFSCSLFLFSGFFGFPYFNHCYVLKKLPKEILSDWKKDYCYCVLAWGLSVAFIFVCLRKGLFAQFTSGLSLVSLVVFGPFITIEPVFDNRLV